MTAYVIRKGRPNPVIAEAFAILRKGEAKAKKAEKEDKEPAPTPAKKAAAKKKPAAKKGAKRK